MNNNQDNEKDPRFLIPVIVVAAIVITAALIVPPVRTVATWVTTFFTGH